MQQLLRYRGKNFTLNEGAEESFQKITNDLRDAQKLVDRNWPVCPIHRCLRSCGIKHYASRAGLEWENGIKTDSLWQQSPE